MLLENKVILVTGSTTGIGEAIARRCVKEGAKVMVHGRDKGNAKALCEELGENNSAYTIADLAKSESYEQIVQDTIDKFGSLHGLVNNAALTTRSNIDTSDEKMFDRIVDVNMKAPLLITRAAVRFFRSQKIKGNVVNIGSINAYCGEKNLLVYSMTKAALMTFTRNLADALGPEQIRFNQLNVGWTLTPNEIKLKESEGFKTDWESRVPKIFAPTGKLLRPEEVASHVAFWLSDASAPVSGAVCDVEQYPLGGRNLISELLNL